MGTTEVDCGSLIVVGFGVWVMAKVGCWSLETANVWVLRGHGEISVGEGFGGDRRESLHG